MAFQDTGAAGWSWSNPSGQSLSSDDADSWQFAGGQETGIIRPFGWIRHHVVISPRPLQGSLRLAYNPSNATPPIPTGAVGTLTLKFKAAATAKTWAFNAKLFNFRTQADSTQGGKLYYVYDWIESAETSTDTITVS